MAGYHVAVVGVGLVGEHMVRELKRRRFPIASLRLFARTKRDVTIGEDTYHVEVVSPDAFAGVDFAFFAGTEGEKGVSLTYAREAVARGAVVIDNGSDFRMDPEVPLIVPEVNGVDAIGHKGIIANPNCSTAQMVMALDALRRAGKIYKVVVATYQSVSGAGRGGVVELDQQEFDIVNGRPAQGGTVFPHHIAGNVIPQIGPFGPDGYCTEETKMVRETQKILHDDSIKVYPTTVRVPVRISHAEALYVELDRVVSVAEAAQLFASYPGIRVVDDQHPLGDGHVYPMPPDASGEAEVLIGRIRGDIYGAPSLSFWVVADNLLKGAATNAVQIAEWIVAHRPVAVG
jgi:aspartate-semialdehyde dehydrogenase